MKTISAGPITRFHRNQKNYTKYLARLKKTNQCCVFCDQNNLELDNIIEKTADYFVVTNRFGYDLWDGCPVVEHLMIIPIKHVMTLNDLADNQQLAIAQASASYEANGYSLYSRAPTNTTRTVNHQHTHLIKLGTKPRKIVLYLRKPHVLFSR